MHGCISKQKTVFVCFLEVWHLAPLLNPAYLGWAYIRTPQLPAEVGTAHTFVECVWVCPHLRRWW